MNRRIWIRTVAAGSIGLWSTRLIALEPDSEAPDPAYRRFPFLPSPGSEPKDQDVVPFGVKRIAIGSTGVILRPNFEQPDTNARTVYHFRITVAADCRELASFQLSLPQSDDILTTFEVNYGCPMQPFQVRLDPKWLAAIQDEGLHLRQVVGTQPIEIFCSTDTPRDDCLPWIPHLVESRNIFDRKASMFDALFSTRSLAPFGWEEGCIDDALWQLIAQGGHPKAESALRNRFESIGALQHSWRPKGGFHSIESTLPLAVLARLDSRHPILEEAVSFWQSRIRGNDIVADYSATAEGCYTVAYPMAVLARQWKRPELGEWALQQLRLRKTALTSGEDIYLRQNPESLNRSYRNWSRGVAWYLLGLLRTLEQIGGDFEVADLEHEFHRVAQICLKHQRSDGLWPCFLDTPDILPDTAGSAGIAAALVGGARLGLIEVETVKPFSKAWSSLLGQLTADGLLTGVAQSNKGGEALQRSDFRVSMAMGLGLLGQFAAERMK